MMKNLSRSRLLWTSATILSALLYICAFYIFPQAFPIVHVDITMDLEQAIEQADIIAQKYNLGPVDYRNAALFNTDNNVKTFIELEAGGKDAFVAMMDEKLYMPYTWRIRHFKEHEKNESTITFTPDGKPYGFIETISENSPGAQLSEQEARIIAEDSAIHDWNVNLSLYKLVEASQKTEMSKRIDHTFVYERIYEKIGEGQYRLKIVVSGDKTTELTHFVKVPESFMRRYAHMRSANTTITVVASFIMYLLYVLGGCCIGLYWLFRRRFQIIRPAVIWAFIIACCTTLASANQLPIWWMSYNSAESINGFLGRLLLMFFIALVGQTALLSLIITTAEGLTRRAFGNHPQFWSLWLSDNRASLAVLGRTFGGYLLVGFNIAFVVTFYLFSLRYLGWWSPSEQLFDPNILATYVPWLSPVALSLSAGFMEECLFRAIPLAGAALLGNYFGKRNLFIGIAFIMQAIVFGAAHANYPVQPAYARLVELLIPSFIWGATYLKFGLLPTIIAHFTYDVIWFSLPIFIAKTTDAFAYKIIIIIITLLPLLYILAARLKRGSWHEFAQTVRNAAWQPTPFIEEKEEITTATPEVVAPVAERKKIVCVLGLLGLIAWISLTRFDHDGITFTVNRNEAVAYANAVLEKKNVVLNEQWKTLPLIFAHYNLVPHIAAQHTFIWKKGKKELYHQLLGTYLEPAHWTVRYAQFEGDLIQRAEEHKIMLYNNHVLRYSHQLPESSVGAALSPEEARVIAHAALREQFNLEPTAVTEISATQAQLPNRVNWLFLFSHDALYPLETGQARIAIMIAGDKVVDAARFIHVPEEWARKEQNKQNMLLIIRFVLLILLVCSLLVAIIIAVRQKKTFLFSPKIFIGATGTILILNILDIINGWQTLVGAFNTSIPLKDQLFQLIIGLGVSILVRAPLFGILISYVMSYTHRSSSTRAITNIGAGIGAGFLVAGALTFAHKIVASHLPLWPQYDILGYSVPLLGSLSSIIIQYAMLTSGLSLLCILIDTTTAHWHKHRIIGIFIALLYSLTMISLPSLKMIPLWILMGTGIGLLFVALYHYIVRYNYALIPLATASFMMLQVIQQGIFNAYSEAMLSAVVSICAVIIASGIWYGYLTRVHR